MFPHRYQGGWIATALSAAALVVSACSPDGSLPLDPGGALRSETQEDPGTRVVTLCKTGPEGSWATFSVNATGGFVMAANPTITDVKPFGEQPPACLEVWQSTNSDVVTVTITETDATPGTVLDQIVVLGGLSSSINNNTVTVSVGVSDQTGATVVFKNKEVLEVPGLRVSKSAVASTVSAGSDMSFAITVESTGTATVNGVTLNDPLPGGIGINWSIAAQPAGNPCTIMGAAPTQTLVCNFGNLAPGQIRTVLVTSGTEGALCQEYPNTVTVGATDHASVSASATITIVNCQQVGTEGCTPGFWRQPHHYQFWTGFTPTQPWTAAFDDPGVGFTGATTLGSAVQLEGGGINALARHAVAALLNATSASVQYPLSVSEVQALVNAALASGSYEAAKNSLERHNELGCRIK